jgi:hypothetical protein
MRQRAAAMLAAGGLALGLAPAAWAPDGVANVSVSAAFDRGSITRGQVAVAAVELQNRGPDAATGIVVELRVAGARVLRALPSAGSCTRAAPTRVRCRFGRLGFGTGPEVVIHALGAPGARTIRLSARIVQTATPDGARADDDAGAAIRVSEPGARAPSETSFTFTTRADATVGTRFVATLRLLNRGPGPVEGPTVRFEVRPHARVTLSPLPRRLGVGEERAVRVTMTPLSPGPLSIDIFVGATGRGHATVRVTA